MRILIDIPEKDYNIFINTHFVENTELMFKQSEKDREATNALFRLMDAIKNGEIK